MCLKIWKGKWSSKMMNKQSLLELIQEKVEQEQFELSYHAQIERGKDFIEIDEIETAIRNGEIIEDYPEDVRGHSCLIYGQTAKGPLHVVCGNFHEEKILIITVYIPDKDKWVDFRKRK